MNILAVGCHPDDLEVGCAGTLAKYASLGHKVVMCHVASGDKGHAVIMPAELCEIRTREAEEAAGILGAVEAVSLGVPDLEVSSNRMDMVDGLIDVIRRTKPDVIITHSPEDYMKDHVEVSMAVFDASFSCSVPHKYTNITGCTGIPPIFYMDTLAGINFMPEEYVDISETAELKLKALACHQSQIRWMLEHDGIDFLEFVGTVSRFRGLQSGVKYAEGFRSCRTWPRLSTRRLLP